MASCCTASGRSACLHLVSLLAAVHAELPPGRSVHSLTLRGHQRHFAVRMPTGTALEDITGVLVGPLHGSAGYGADVMPLAAVEWIEVETDVVVLPFLEEHGLLQLNPASRIQQQGGGSLFCWAAGTDNGFCSGPRDGEDEEFMLALLDWSHGQGLADAAVSQAFLVGFSNGARFGWRLLCDQTVARRFAGFGILSGMMSESLRDSEICSVSSMSSPVVVMQGLEDDLADPSWTHESVAWMTNAVGCQEPEAEHVAGSALVLWNSSDCRLSAEGFSLAYYHLGGWGHYFPGPQPLPPGITCLDLMWDAWTGSGAVGEDTGNGGNASGESGDSPSSTSGVRVLRPLHFTLAKVILGLAWIAGA